MLLFPRKSRCLAWARAAAVPLHSHGFWQMRLHVRVAPSIDWCIPARRRGGSSCISQCSFTKQPTLTVSAEADQHLLKMCELKPLATHTWMQSLLFPSLWTAFPPELLLVRKRWLVSCSCNALITCVILKIRSSEKACLETWLCEAIPAPPCLMTWKSLFKLPEHLQLGHVSSSNALGPWQQVLLLQLLSPKQRQVEQIDLD